MICAVILGETLSELEKQIQEARNHGANFIECRLDGLKAFDEQEFESFLKRNNEEEIIISLRSEWKSKEIKPPLEGRRKILKSIIELEPKYIDLEFPIDMNLLQFLRGKTIPVISALDFEGMAKIAVESVINLSKNSDREVIVKFSATPNSVEDLRQLWRWSKKLRKEKLRYIIIGMGQLGQITRIKSRELGNEFTYGRFGEDIGEPYLPGMLKIEELNRANASGAWHLASLGSLPENDALRAIYTELLQASGQNGTFLNIPIKTSPELDQMLLWIEDGLLDGINISSPWQVDVISKLPLKDRSAEIMGAANCVVVTKDGLKGYNTQIAALHRSLEPFSFKRINRVFIDGTERIARAIIEVLKKDVEQIVVRDEMFSGGNKIFDDYDVVIPSNESYSEDFDLIVNCNTPAKGFENVVMLPKKFIENAKIIFDPMSKLTSPTPLMHMAEQMGKQYIGGFQFFYNTALSSFELWTKRSIPPSAIKTDLFHSFEDEIDFGFMLNY